MQNDVTSITIERNNAQSDSKTPTHIADTCACWTKDNARKARKLLKTVPEIICWDATAWCALKSMSLDMMTHGKDVKARLVKAYETE